MAVEYAQHSRSATKAVGVTVVAALALALAANSSTALNAQSVSISQPDSRISVAVGRGKLITLPSPIEDIFIAENSIADVQVRSPRQIYIFGKKGGQTSFYATSATGKVIYSAEVAVGAEISSIDQMLSLAMPEANIAVSTTNNFVLLTGTIANPDDAEEAENLVQAFVGDATKVVSRLKTATPMQVNLKVRFAEVSRTLAKEINGNLLTRDTTGGFQFGVSRGRNFGSITDFNTSAFPKLDASQLFGLPAGSISLPFNPSTGQFVTPGGTAFNYTQGSSGLNTIQAAGRLFGLDIATAFDVSERVGLVSTLASPNLTTISGETATFLAAKKVGKKTVVGAWGSVRPVQELRGKPVLHTHRIVQRPDFHPRRPGSIGNNVQRRGRAGRLQHSGGLHPAGGNHRRAGLGRKLHDRRPDAEQL